ARARGRRATLRAAHPGAGRAARARARPDRLRTPEPRDGLCGEGLTEDRIARRNELLDPMLRSQSRPYLPGTNAPCGLATERPARPVDERHSADPSVSGAATRPGRPQSA